MSRLYLLRLLSLSLVISFASFRASAIPVSYHNQADYLSAANAIYGPSNSSGKNFILSTANFDSGGQNLPFQSTMTANSGRDVIRTSGFNTTSPDHYLGIKDPLNFNQFSDGDILTYRYSSPNNISASRLYGVGMSFISGDQLDINDILVSIDSSPFPVSARNFSVLDDGGFAYYLGVLFNNREYYFNEFSITFKPDNEINFLYNIDDISLVRSVPAPSMIVIFPTALLMFALFHSRSKKVLWKDILALCDFRLNRNQLLA